MQQGHVDINATPEQLLAMLADNKFAFVDHRIGDRTVATLGWDTVDGEQYYLMYRYADGAIHRLNASCTDATRLHAHWAGFKANCK